MPIIDADCHVIESDRTWEFMDESEAKYKPVTVVPTSAGGPSGGFWMIEGKARARRAFDPEKARTPVERGEMLDIKARLSHMDELGVDVQVLYPTLFLTTTLSPAAEVAMYKSYNRWQAEIWRAAKGRLRWTIMAPFQTMEKALEELHVGKEHGACGVFMRGIEGDKAITDPYFFPIYAEAQKLDMPVCFHAGSSSRLFETIYSGPESLLWAAKAPILCAFHSLVLSKVPDRFPDLRWGFIEASGSWVPYLLHDLTARFDRMSWAYGKRGTEDLLTRNRFFVACQTDDDVPYVLKYAGEDNLVIGSDYGHADTSSELEALRNLKKQGTVKPAVVDKILGDNPKRLYAL
jgi:predicted TIM-barrel fold metal-dependent hydrolase